MINGVLHAIHVLALTTYTMRILVTFSSVLKGNRLTGGDDDFSSVQGFGSDMIHMLQTT